MSRAKAGYTGNADDFLLDTLDQQQRLEMVEKLKEFYPATLPADWDDFTELNLAASRRLPIPHHFNDPTERFCHYIYYAAAKVIADHKGDELSANTTNRAAVRTS